MATLEDLLEDIRERLRAAEEVVGDQPGPLPEPERATVRSALQRAETESVQILDPGEQPVLDPPTAGHVMSASFSGLPSYAERFKQWGDQAYSEIQKIDPDDDYIGDRLRTIRHYMDEYRQKAGIAA